MQSDGHKYYKEINMLISSPSTQRYFSVTVFTKPLGYKSRVLGKVLGPNQSVKECDDEAQVKWLIVTLIDEPTYLEWKELPDENTLVVDEDLYTSEDALNFFVRENKLKLKD